MDMQTEAAAPLSYVLTETASVYPADSLVQNSNQYHLQPSLFSSSLHEAFAGFSSDPRVSVPGAPFSSDTYECPRSIVGTSGVYGGFLPIETACGNKFMSPQGGGGNTSQNEWLMNAASNHLTSRFNNGLSLSLAANPSFIKPSKPFLGSAAFLHVMQEILAEIASFALDHNICCSSEENRVAANSIGGFSDQTRPFLGAETKKKHLLGLLQLVDEQYNQCLDEIHTVISAFHAVTDLDPNLHARFALPRISIMYKNLRGRISSHILAMGSDPKEGEVDSKCLIEKQWSLQQLKKKDQHQLWKPQRGLPEQSVSVLKAWMFQNFLHPYPKDAEKHLLALKSGLTRSQVSNWFINARVRLWKPMIEEMYAETNRRKSSSSSCRSIKNNQESSAALKTSSSIPTSPFY